VLWRVQRKEPEAFGVACTSIHRSKFNVALVRITAFVSSLSFRIFRFTLSSCSRRTAACPRPILIFGHSPTTCATCMLLQHGLHAFTSLQLQTDSHCYLCTWYLPSPAGKLNTCRMHIYRIQRRRLSHPESHIPPI
jgi:hypothetical protein